MSGSIRGIRIIANASLFLALTVNQAIDASSVHRITSGQVIVDLQTAVKELVENSLDAGATIIDVRFRESGVESFEVADNGSGIAQQDYATVALKSHTSKLSSYDDLLGVTSFGFRGEALASLCQLADVNIVTATEEDAPMAKILTFDRRGNLASSSGRVARSRGTSVTVKNLFNTVPVRRKEFERNAKKHFANVQTLLQAYALIASHCKVSLTNQAGSKHAQTMFKSDGRSKRENYALLFSAKAALSLMDFSFEIQPSQSNQAHESAGASTSVRIEGLVSKPLPECGRSSADRQFCYINGRPFDGKILCRAFNDAYKGYLPSRYPSIVANLVLPADFYDVNVSPDKRTIFLHSEKQLVEALKSGLEALFQPYRSTYAMDSVSMVRKGKQPRNGHSSQVAATPTNVDASALRRDGIAVDRTSIRAQTLSPERDAVSSLDSEDIDEDIISSKLPDPVIARNTSNVSLTEEPPDVPASTHLNRDATAPSSSPLQSPDASAESSSDLLNRQAGPVHAAATDLRVEGAVTALKQAYLDLRNTVSIPISSVANHNPPRKRQRLNSPTRAVQTSIETFVTSRDTPVLASGPPESSTEITASSHESSQINRRFLEYEEPDDNTSGILDPLPASLLSQSPDLDDLRPQSPLHRPTSAKSPTPSASAMSLSSNGNLLSVNDDSQDQDASSLSSAQYRTDSRQSIASVAEGVLPLDLPRVRSNIMKRKQAASQVVPDVTQGSAEGLQDAGIETAEVEAQAALSRLVNKSDFGTMSVVGQFNLAFIIARRTKHGQNASEEVHDDLMIIDQHASDEKYNYERLQQVTKIDSQRLIQPRNLSLPASDELIAIDHQDVLRFNGFDIEIDEDAPSGQRLKLVALPVSKSTKKTEFTLEDLEELLFLLRDHTGSNAIRPSKTRKLFAMLACRSSVMVGKALSNSRMTSIVRHMGEIDQPWNCPHGRNTMRWLVGLKKPIPDQRFGIGAARLSRLRADITVSR